MTTAPRDGAPRHLHLPDGRRLAYAEYGDPAGRPALYCHGFPSSRREARLLEPAATRLGVRLIAIDRPGYGGSDYWAGRTIASWANDCARLLDHLGFAQVALIGVSGGGPFALACAARIPHRLTACTLVCALGPIYLPEVLGTMAWPARTALQLVRTLPKAAGLVYGRHSTAVLARWPTLIEHVRDAAAPVVDRALLAEPRIRDIMNGNIRDALGAGALGARQDIQLYTRPWDLPLTAIPVPIVLWHGDLDGSVPVAHARWYLRHLPRCTGHIVPGEGHFSLPLGHAEAILGDLIANACNGAAARAEIDAPPATA